MKRSPCFLKQFSDKPCDGRLVKVHLVPQQLLKKEFPHGVIFHDNRWRRAHPIENPEWAHRSLRQLQGDPRSYVMACGGPMGPTGHHGMLDGSRTLRIPRYRIPAGTEQFVAELGLRWFLDREYGVDEVPF